MTLILILWLVGFLYALLCVRWSYRKFSDAGVAKTTIWSVNRLLK